MGDGPRSPDFVDTFPLLEIGDTWDEGDAESVAFSPFSEQGLETPPSNASPSEGAFSPGALHYRFAAEGADDVASPELNRRDAPAACFRPDAEALVADVYDVVASTQSPADRPRALPAPRSLASSLAPA